MTDLEPTVLVAGAGISGLAAAVFLAWHGVPVEVVEARSGSLVHPRARTVNPRTAELLRQVGIEEEVLGARSYTRAWPSVLRLRADTLAGPELHRVEQRPPRKAEGDRDVSCCRWGAIDQDLLEGILLRKARELGAVVDFRTRVDDLAQDETGVTVQVTGPDGVRATRRADYVIGADGTMSTVRRLLGVRRRGPGSINHQLSMVFQADLSGPFRGRHAPEQNRFVAVTHLNKPVEGTVLSPYGSDKWVFYTPYDPSRDGTADDFDDRRCAELIRAAVGVDDLDVALVPQLADGTKVLGYEVAGLVAERFRAGRVFLVGDSAHAMPPAGAFGAGTCFLDAHNLAWKLAMVVRGQTGPALLDTYEQERLPAAQFTLGQAMAQMREIAGVGHAAVEAVAPVDYDTVVFGYRYTSDAVVSEEDGVSKADGVSEAGGGSRESVPAQELAGQPGTRAPHVELAQPGASSTLDFYGSEPVLLVGTLGDAWCEAAKALTERTGIALRVRGLTLPAEVGAAHAITAEGAVLVRPDGVVAWRSAAAAADPAAPRGHAGDHMLCRAIDRDLQPAV
jgi:2-polyprenyl-6-methoxyphenol hydroxylase-like FAD-dependent oxidoreductase